MVVKTFALVKKMSDGRQKSERRTTLIKFKATLLPPSITLIKNNFDSTGTGCGLFPESKAKKKFVKSFGDSTTVLNSKVVTIMHIGCKWLLFSVEGEFNPGLFNPKLPPQTFQPQTFQP